MASPSISALRDRYTQEFAAIGRRFEDSGDGRAVLVQRSALVDALAGELWRLYTSPDVAGPRNCCLVALGGYGRTELFPYSDVDILFLCGEGDTEAQYKGSASQICREMWDLRLRVSPCSRTLAECGRLHRDNLEFNVALLDCRYVAGDAELFAALHDRVLPQLVVRERQALVRNLADLSRERHAKHGNTIFHLEPSLKDAPGGLRDYHLAGWLSLIAAMEKDRAWPASPRRLFPVALRDECSRAIDFLAATRCFLHYRQQRDDNLLSYELQAEAAAAGIGNLGRPLAEADWMCNYFRNARSIHRLAVQMLDEVLPARSGLYGAFQSWRSRVSNAEFSVVHGRVFVKQPGALKDPAAVLRLFEFQARHGLALSAETERRLAQALPSAAASVVRLPELWPALRRILLLPHAADALRSMHHLGLLVLLFPELRVIDSLVIRDFYHRYTVDEHSFMTIENLHRLRLPTSDLEERYGEILSEAERPDLLYLALLFHDVGKGLPGESHVEASLQAIQPVFARLGIDPSERETVQFLIANHLEMSATLLRRDIFDPETVRGFAEKVGTAEHLKALCLFTYSDIKAVNPEALTPWKAEMLWQLYASTSNYLSRSLDAERVHLETDPDLSRFLAAGAAGSAALAEFLEGLPRRYLQMHSPEEVSEHCSLAGRLGEDPVQLRLLKRGHSYQLTLVTADRPFLFASIAGTLAAWGMHILKAEAFSNGAGVVLDSFSFSDPYRTLELNPTEVERFQRSMVDVLTGRVSLRTLMQGRSKPGAHPPAKINVTTRIHFDDVSSSHSTLLELVTQDRPGLLYRISSLLAEFGCNIEIALIDTEGQKAIDVFYLTSSGAKLDVELQRELREALLEQL